MTMTADEMRAYRRRYYDERVLINGRLVSRRGVHGLDSTYTNYGCRCDACTVAVRAYNRARRARYIRNALNRERQRVANQMRTEP